MQAAKKAAAKNAAKEPKRVARATRMSGEGDISNGKRIGRQRSVASREEPYFKRVRMWERACTLTVS